MTLCGSEHLVTGGDDAHLCVWKIADVAVQHTGYDSISIEGAGGAYALAWDKSIGLTCGGYDGSVRLFSTDAAGTILECTHNLVEHSDGVSAMCVLSGGRFVSGSYDCSFKVWSINETRVNQAVVRQCSLQHAQEHAHVHSITAIIDMGDGTLLTAAYDTKLCLWASQGDFELLQKLHGHDMFVLSALKLEPTPPGFQWSFLTGGGDKTIRVWDTDMVPASTLIQPSAVAVLEMLGSGEFLSGTSNGLVQAWA